MTLLCSFSSESLSTTSLTLEVDKRCSNVSVSNPKVVMKIHYTFSLTDLVGLLGSSFNKENIFMKNGGFDGRVSNSRVFKYKGKWKLSLYLLVDCCTSLTICFMEDCVTYFISLSSSEIYCFCCYFFCCCIVLALSKNSSLNSLFSSS